MSSRVALVISNCPPDQAQNIAQALIAQRCAACVTLSPVQSVYRWEGEVCIDQEVTLTAKVSHQALEHCVEHLRSLHPYELPEILVIPVDTQFSHTAYLDWVEQECEVTE